MKSIINIEEANMMFDDLKYLYEHGRWPNSQLPEWYHKLPPASIRERSLINIKEVIDWAWIQCALVFEEHLNGNS